MQLYIIRHAQSTNNALLDHRDRVYDPPLTGLGRRQADLLARYLATQMDPVALPRADHVPGSHGYGIRRLYTSPMRRALQTSKAIGAALGLPPEVWIDLHEQGGIFLDHGKERGRVAYPGMTRHEMLAEYPELLLPDVVTGRGWWTGGYEEMPACWGRASRVAARLRKWSSGDESIAIVTHGGFLDALLKTLFNQPLDGSTFYANRNTAISCLRFGPDGQLRIQYLNQVPHLPAALIS